VCLIAIALERHPRFPLVIAANRDEFLDRPAAALDWWQTAPAEAPVLGGRDLQAGGTWMGLNTRGRIAMLTNVRDLPRHVPTAPSRGAVVPGWLATDKAASAYWAAVATRSHNPFNLLAGDMASGQWWWAGDRAGWPQALGPGLYGLSNAALDTPWPKVQRLKAALDAALAEYVDKAPAVKLAPARAQTTSRRQARRRRRGNSVMSDSRVRAPAQARGRAVPGSSVDRARSSGQRGRERSVRPGPAGAIRRCECQSWEPPCRGRL